VKDKMTKTIMFQGTASNVGKSMMAVALCRILYQEGYRVAPFKSWNMALNSYVTKNGGEVGRAQALQAEACNIEVTVNMQPFLIKPKGKGKSQVIVKGKPLGDFTDNYQNKEYIQWALRIIKKSLNELFLNYEVVVMEGAGSPAEINIKDRDLANMKVAELFKTPVILVADIDKGGVFASIVGTLELLGDKKDLIEAIIINKFRGSRESLQSGLKFIENKTGIPVLGVMPYLKNISLPEEDSVMIKEHKNQKAEIKIGVIKLPHISNFTDFDILGMEPLLELNYIDSDQNDLGKYDAVILPGTKNTTEDLFYIKEKGLDNKIIEAAEKGVEIIGICGGYQMLGNNLIDPEQTEGSLNVIEGLSLLDIETEFSAGKKTHQIEAITHNNLELSIDFSKEVIKGYEIHMGKTALKEDSSPLFKIISRSNQECLINDGAISKDQKVWGTYIHGIFDNDIFRKKFINKLSQDKIKKRDQIDLINFKEQRSSSLDQLAEEVKKNMDMDLLYRIIGLD